MGKKGISTVATLRQLSINNLGFVRFAPWKRPKVSVKNQGIDRYALRQRP